MNTYYGQSLVLVLLCFVVPGFVALSPVVLTRSPAARWGLHICIVGASLGVLLYGHGIVPQRAVVTLALLGLAQYWVLVLLEKVFERRYGRAPRVMFMVAASRTLKLEDSLVTLAYFVITGVAVASALAAAR